MELEDGELNWDLDEYAPKIRGFYPLKDSEYAEKKEALLEAKEKIKNANRREKYDIVQNLLDKGIYKNQIQEYIGYFKFL